MDILLTGSIAIDRIMNFPGKFADVIQPDKLHVLSLSVLLNNMKDTRGGVAANIAYNLALLGEKPILLGAVGKESKNYMNDLKKLGVQTKYVHYSSKPTASFTVMTDVADCQIGGFYPGAMGDSATLDLAPFQGKNIFYVISPHDPKMMAKQIREAKKSKLRVFYDIGQQSTNVSEKDLKAGVLAAELLIVNDYEMEVIEKRTRLSRGEILKAVKVLVVTLGEKGCVIYAGSKEQKVKALKVKKVVDPTGAGDAYRAGFLYGYVKNWELEECAKLGAVVASYAIESHGTQEHTFSTSDVKKRYKKTYGEEIALK